MIPTRLIQHCVIELILATTITTKTLHHIPTKLDKCLNLTNHKIDQSIKTDQSVWLFGQMPRLVMGLYFMLCQV